MVINTIAIEIDPEIIDGTVAKIFDIITTLIGTTGEKLLDILGFFIIGSNSGNPIGVLLLTLIFVGTAFMVLRRALAE